MTGHARSGQGTRRAELAEEREARVDLRIANGRDSSTELTIKKVESSGGGGPILCAVLLTLETETPTQVSTDRCVEGVERKQSRPHSSGTLESRRQESRQKHSCVYPRRAKVNKTDEGL